jgi:sugar fermentation stimulation protein A
VEEGVALFPDAVSVRGTKHLRELAAMVGQGCRAVIFFCVQRNDAREVRPADQIDPVYGNTLREVMARGVEALAYEARVSLDGIVLDRVLPVVCP